MIIRWSQSALGDVERLHDFLLPHDPKRAAEIVDLIIGSPEALIDFPRRGTVCAGFGDREVREFRVGSYLLRYELAGEALHVLRIFHARENRAADKLP